jgi:integrase
MYITQMTNFGGYLMQTTQPLRDKNQICLLMTYYHNESKPRNCLLIIISLFTALRISDILRLNWNDVYDFTAKRMRKYISLTEKKSGKSKIIAVNKHITAVLECYMKEESAAPGKPLFINKRTGKAISRVQAYRIIRAAAEAVDIPERVSSHSLRKTFGYHAWKSGVSPAVIMEIYNHCSFAVTRRYLGVTQDDKNEVYLDLDYSLDYSELA